MRRFRGRHSVDEASKTRAIWGAAERRITSGKGIDIGAGTDPIRENVRRFDVEDGDANEILRHVDGQFDFVFSAHCLEHMEDPASALQGWFQLVKPGGYLILVVPDEDLYEQGYWPSVFNPDHKWTFTIRRDRNRSPRSCNVADLMGSLNNAELVSMDVHDVGYDRRLLSTRPWPRKVAVIGAMLRLLAVLILRKFGAKTDPQFVWRLLGLPIDQTLGDATAQIQAIVRKEGKDSIA